MVYQDLSLVESLSVGANLMLNREPTTRFGFLKKRELMAEAEAFIKQHKFRSIRARRSARCHSPTGR